MRLRSQLSRSAVASNVVRMEGDLVRALMPVMLTPRLLVLVGAVVYG